MPGGERMPFTFCVVGDDGRQTAAAKELARNGYRVVGAEQVAVADCILLPMPLDGPMPGLTTLLRAARPGAVALGGRVGEQARQAAKAAGILMEDYAERPELTCLNAVPTAEGCLCLLMQMRSRTLWESPILVLGYGRIGRAVARRLCLLGACVTVAARSPEQRAAARCASCRAEPLTALERLLPGFDAVVNTIPAPVLPRVLLERMPKGAVVVDLASKPGGTDFAAASELGLNAVHALGLPAKCAPETAGALVAHTALAILQERGADLGKKGEILE